MFVAKTGKSRVVEFYQVRQGGWCLNMSTSIELMRRKVRFMDGGAVCDGT